MSIEDDIAFFEHVPMLGMLGRGALRILAIGAESRYVHGGEVLFSAGDPADGAYVIQEGGFHLRAYPPDVYPDVTVGVGALLGETALIAETRRAATATAVSPSTVLRIPRSLFLKMLDSFPEAAYKLRELLANRTEQVLRDIHEVGGMLDAQGRK